MRKVLVKPWCVFHSYLHMMVGISMHVCVPMHTCSLTREKVASFNQSSKFKASLVNKEKKFPYLE